MGVHHLLGRRGCSRRELDDGDRPLVPPLAGGPSTVTLLHPPLPLAGFSIATERGCQRNGSARRLLVPPRVRDGDDAGHPDSGQAWTGTQSEVIRAIWCAWRRVAPQSEVIGAILFEDSPCCGGTCDGVLEVDRADPLPAGPGEGREALSSRRLMLKEARCTIIRGDWGHLVRGQSTLSGGGTRVEVRRRRKAVVARQKGGGLRT